MLLRHARQAPSPPGEAPVSVHIQSCSLVQCHYLSNNVGTKFDVLYVLVLLLRLGSPVSVAARFLGFWSFFAPVALLPGFLPGFFFSVPSFFVSSFDAAGLDFFSGSALFSLAAGPGLRDLLRPFPLLAGTSRPPFFSPSPPLCWGPSSSTSNCFILVS